MEYSPMPMFETERNGLGRECEESLGVAAMQRLFLMEENDGTTEARPEFVYLI